jgi:hypothetical protein
MKVITSIRMAFAMSLLFISSMACKKEDATTSSPIVGKWLLYQLAEDDNNNQKIDESEWLVLKKADYDNLKNIGILVETVFEGNGTGYTIDYDGEKEPFKWGIKADGTFYTEDTDPPIPGFTKNPNTTDVLYIDSNGDLREDRAAQVISLGITTIVPTGLKFKRN